MKIILTGTKTLFNSSQLAEELGRGRGYISAMKKGPDGFKFSHGMRTQLKPALDWLAAHPEFREANAYPAKMNQKRRLQKLQPKTVVLHLASLSGKPDEPSCSHD